MQLVAGKTACVHPNHPPLHSTMMSCFCLTTTASTANTLLASTARSLVNRCVLQQRSQQQQHQQCQHHLSCLQNAHNARIGSQTHAAARTTMDASTAAEQQHNRNLALLFTKWANKPTYARLLRERGVPVVDAEQAAAHIDWSAVVFATVWNPPPGLLDKCPNLRCVMSLGAGVDALLLQPGVVPEHLPVARIVDPLMASRMATWVVWGVINWQRRMEQYAAAQRSCRWDTSIELRGANLDNCDVAVGVMGLGVMGLATAQALQALGYQVSGWTRSPTAASGQQQQERAGIACYAGQQQLRAFVAAQDVLVCLLPLTQETAGIINGELLSWLRPGAAVINGGRGRHVLEPDLLHALDSGQVGFALLDVFTSEPLPQDSPLWRHPSVRLTPHVASMTTLATAADQIAANYHAVVAGKGLLPATVVDRERGY